MEKLRVDPWRRPRPFPTETQHTLTRSSPAKAKERWLRRSNGPGPRPEAAGPLNAPGLTPVLLASLRAPHQPACRRGGVPVTPAAPGPWQIGSIGSNSPWAVPGTFSAHCPPLPGPLPLSWIKPLFPALHHLLLSLFCFTSPHSLLSIFPSRLPLKERDLNRQPLPLPNAHHHNTTLDRSRRVFPPRSSSEAAKASITPSLATDDQGKLFFCS